MLHKQVRKGMLLVLMIVVLAVPVLVQAGGWAVVSLESLPQEIVAARPFTIRFAVLQHGQHLAELPAKVTAVHPSTGDKVTVDGVLAEDGYLEAILTLPQAGRWQWHINSFGYDHAMPPLTVSPAPLTHAGVEENGRATLYAWSFSLLGMATAIWGWRQQHNRVRLAFVLAALALVGWGMWLGVRREATAIAQPTDSTTAAIDSDSWGEALFVAKGCIACHQNERVTMADNMHPFGPNLSQYSNNEEFLSLWLQDPAQIKPDTQMPNLNLTNDEIQILADFLK